MGAQGRIRAGQSTASYAFRGRAVLAFACIAACAGWLYSQSAQPTQSSTSAQQPAAAHQAPPQQPMVMGEGPDAEDNSDTTASTAPASASPAPAPAASAASPVVVQPATWNPVTEAPGAAAVPQPSALPVGQPAASPEPPPPPVHAADAGGDQARQQINNECADMMQMANDLKSEVDKTNKDVLSLAVVRKANDIEQLAHRVRDQMRPEIGKN